MCDRRIIPFEKMIDGAIKRYPEDSDAFTFSTIIILATVGDGDRAQWEDCTLSKASRLTRATRDCPSERILSG